MESVGGGRRWVAVGGAARGSCVGVAGGRGVGVRSGGGGCRSGRRGRNGHRSEPPGVRGTAGRWLLPAAIELPDGPRAREPLLAAPERVPLLPCGYGTRSRVRPAAPARLSRVGAGPWGIRWAPGGPDFPRGRRPLGHPVGSPRAGFRRLSARGLRGAGGGRSDRRISAGGLRGAAGGRSDRRVSAGGLRGAATLPDIAREQVLVIARPLPEHDRRRGRRSEPLGESPG